MSRREILALLVTVICMVLSGGISCVLVAVALSGNGWAAIGLVYGFVQSISVVGIVRWAEENDV